MEALQLDPKSHNLSHGSTDIPVITGPQDVIIKVAYAGVCGTDLHVIKGDYPCSQQPFILGHEFCGEVYAVGSEVKSLQRGDRVAVDPNIGCGLCKYCHTASYHLCPTGSINSALGIFSDGGWAQLCKMSAKQVYKLPPSVSYKEAALLEPLSCVYHGYTRLTPLNIGENILIGGAGIIGTLWCCFLHHLGHRRVYVSEPSEERRELLKKLDTGFTITDPAGIHKIFSKDGVSGIDLYIDCSGNSTAMEQSFSILNRGGKLCIFGVSSPSSKMSISPFEIFIKELTVYGVTVNPYSFQPAIGLMDAMGSRYFDYERLGIEEFTLSQHNEAIKALHDRKISKAIFRINNELK